MEVNIKSQTLIELAEKLGTTAEDLAPAYVNYLYVDGLCDLGIILFTAFACGVTAVCTYLVLRKDGNKSEAISCALLSSGICLLLCLFASIPVKSGVCKTLEPQGAAIHKLVRGLK